MTSDCACPLFAASEANGAKFVPCVLSPLVGMGYDEHILVEGRLLMLGGVEIPHDRGEKGHSDGDVLLHAVIDSLLSAAHLGDIGEMFPVNNDKWQGASSCELLKIAYNEVKNAGYIVHNISCIVKLERPNLKNHKRTIERNIASLLAIEEKAVSLTAKTGEGVGEVGRCEAVEAWSTCLLLPASLGHAD